MSVTVFINCVFPCWNMLKNDFHPIVCLSKPRLIPYVSLSCLFTNVSSNVQTQLCLCWQCTVKAASVLHDKLFRRLLLSPMHFFDTTPLGRILTRFSRDMDEGEAWFVLTVNLSPQESTQSVKSPWLTRCSAKTQYDLTWSIFPSEWVSVIHFTGVFAWHVDLWLAFF